MSVYAQLQDFEDVTGTPVPIENAHVVQELLDEAEVVLAVHFGDLADRIESELTTAVHIRTAVVGMVRALLRTEESRSVLLAGSTTYEERSSISASLRVTRRERWLLGAFTNASSMDLSDRDPQLRYPTRPAGTRESRIWR